ncbi:hydrolase, partial [Burkholderia pseudomallei]
VLFLSGKVTWRLHPIVDKYVKALLEPNTTQAKADEIIAWAQLRSHETDKEELKRRRAPVKISKKIEDHKITQNSSMTLFSNQ